MKNPQPNPSTIFSVDQIRISTGQSCSADCAPFLALFNACTIISWICSSCVRFKRRLRAVSMTLSIKPCSLPEMLFRANSASNCQFGVVLVLEVITSVIGFCRQPADRPALQALHLIEYTKIMCYDFPQLGLLSDPKTAPKGVTGTARVVQSHLPRTVLFFIDGYPNPRECC
jgi:hypothetical protein